VVAGTTCSPAGGVAVLAPSCAIATLALEALGRDVGEMGRAHLLPRRRARLLRPMVRPLPRLQRG